MAASDPEIKDGLTLPVWMKSKPAKEFEPFAASPPPPEDSFFYIRYPKTDLLKPKIEPDLTKVIAEKTNELGAAAQKFKGTDWSKHTKPCQDVIHEFPPINTAANAVASKPKPAGIDDGFKGEGASCGTSVVKVAHQMVHSSTSRGFTVASPEEDGDFLPPPRALTRRGSRSLPVTPQHSPTSSPKSRRKNINRYFTSPFEPVDDASNRSWLSMALLGFRRDLTTSTSTLAEEDAIEARLQGASLAESVENLGPAPKNKEPTHSSNDYSTQQPKLSKPAPAFRPKPTELREMNFWSPTSM